MAINIILKTQKTSLPVGTISNGDSVKIPSPHQRSISGHPARVAVSAIAILRPIWDDFGPARFALFFEQHGKILAHILPDSVVDEHVLAVPADQPDYVGSHGPESG